MASPVSSRNASNLSSSSVEERKASPNPTQRSERAATQPAASSTHSSLTPNSSSSRDSAIEALIVQQARSWSAAGKYRESAKLLQPFIEEKIVPSLSYNLFQLQCRNYLALKNIDKAIKTIDKAAEFLRKNKTNLKIQFSKEVIQDIFWEQMKLYHESGQDTKAMQAFDHCIDIVKEPTASMLNIRCFIASRMQDYRTLLRTVDQALSRLSPEHAERDALHLTNLKIEACCGLGNYDAAVDALIACYHESKEQASKKRLKASGVDQGLLELFGGSIVRQLTSMALPEQTQADELAFFALQIPYLSLSPSPLSAHNQQVIQLIDRLLKHKDIGLKLSDRRRGGVRLRQVHFLLHEREFEEAEGVLKLAKSELDKPFHPQARAEIELLEAIIAREKGKKYGLALDLLDHIEFGGIDDRSTRTFMRLYRDIEIARTQLAAELYDEVLETVKGAIELGSKMGAEGELILRELLLIQSKAQRKLGLLGERVESLSDPNSLPSNNWSFKLSAVDNFGVELLVETTKSQRESKQYEKAIETANLGLLHEDLMRSKAGRIMRAKLLYNKAWSEASLKQYQEAIHTVDSVKDFEKECPDQVQALLYFAKAWSQRKLAQFDEALVTLEQALRLKGVDPKTRAQLKEEKSRAESGQAKSQPSVKIEKNQTEAEKKRQGSARARE